MIVKGHEGHVISVITVFKVHYNQKLGGHSAIWGGNTPWPLGLISKWVILNDLERRNDRQRALSLRYLSFWLLL